MFNEYLNDEAYGSKVVLELMSPLLNQEYMITMDNWFSNPDLFENFTKIELTLLEPCVRTNKAGKTKKG